MTSSYDPAMTGSDPILAYLQELLLTATLLGERLPGARRPLRLLPGGLPEIPSRIVGTNLAASLKLDELPRRLDILSVDQLKGEVDRSTGGAGGLSFMAFKPADWHTSHVELSLVIGSIWRVEGDMQCRELGRVDAAFYNVDGRWTALTEPHVFLAPDY